MDHQSCLRLGLRPGFLGLEKVSSKKLLVNKQTKQNQPETPVPPNRTPWAATCTFKNNNTR